MGMIEPRELRIGNYVNINDDAKSLFKQRNVFFSNFIRVSAIEDHILKIIDNRGSQVEINKHMATPIPLTEEILLKCNQDFNKLGFEFSYGADHVKVYFRSVYIRDIEYLHDFQNLHHSITGEELEIEL
jgi:hypothetical protein